MTHGGISIIWNTWLHGQGYSSPNVPNNQWHGGHLFFKQCGGRASFGLFAKGNVKCKVKSCLKYCRLLTILPLQVEGTKKSILFSNPIITVICPFHMACKILASPAFYSLRNSLNSLNCRFCIVEFDIRANKVQFRNWKSWSGLVKAVATWILVQGHIVGLEQDL